MATLGLAAALLLAALLTYLSLPNKSWEHLGPHLMSVLVELALVVLLIEVLLKYRRQRERERVLGNDDLELLLIDIVPVASLSASAFAEGIKEGIEDLRSQRQAITRHIAGLKKHTTQLGPELEANALAELLSLRDELGMLLTTANLTEKQVGVRLEGPFFEHAYETLGRIIDACEYLDANLCKSVEVRERLAQARTNMEYFAKQHPVGRIPRA